MIKESEEFVNNGYWGYYFRAKHLPLVVVFGFRDLEKGKFSHFSYFRNTKYNVLFLNSHENNWYQSGIEGLGSTHEETLSSLKEIIKEFEATLITFFGFSMGAYGAILYSCFLHPTKVVALAPEFDLKLDFSRSLENLGEKPLLKQDLTKLLQNNIVSDIHVLCGDIEAIDLYFYAKYKDVINGSFTFIKGCAHYVTSFLHSENEFDTMITSLPTLNRYELPSKYVLDHIDDLSLEDAAAFLRAENLYKYKKFKESVELFSTIEASFKEWGPFWWHFGRSYLKSKEYEKAKECFKRAIDIQEENPYFLFDLANAFRLNNEQDKALEILNSISEKQFVGDRAKRLIAKIKS